MANAAEIPARRVTTSFRADRRFRSHACSSCFLRTRERGLHGFANKPRVRNPAHSSTLFHGVEQSLWYAHVQLCALFLELKHHWLQPGNARMLDWAEVVFTMDAGQALALEEMFPQHSALAQLVCLQIPDEFTFLQPELVTLLEKRVTPLVIDTVGEQR